MALNRMVRGGKGKMNDGTLDDDGVSKKQPGVKLAQTFENPNTSTHLLFICTKSDL